VRHMRTINGGIRRAQGLPKEELMTLAKELGAPYELLLQVRELGRLPVVNFAAGGIATPADAALMMRLGCDGIFVGSGVFKSASPARMARAIVDATAHYQDAGKLAEYSTGIGDPMKGIELSTLAPAELLSGRGW
jgi:pyridoxal 5'-phosphate synthase pdxS subunit